MRLPGSQMRNGAIVDVALGTGSMPKPVPASLLLMLLLLTLLPSFGS